METKQCNRCYGNFSCGGWSLTTKDRTVYLCDDCCGILVCKLFNSKQLTQQQVFEFADRNYEHFKPTS